MRVEDPDRGKGDHSDVDRARFFAAVALANLRADKPLLTAAARANRRAALANHVLGDQCLEALERLFDYSAESLWDRRADSGLAEAVEAVLVCEQRALRNRRPESPLALDVGLELAYTRAWRIHALLFVTGSAKRAKEVELRLTGGAPLAICTGRTWAPPPDRDTAAPFLGVPARGMVIDGRGRRRDFNVPALGCLSIFEDALQAERHPWRYWCDDCQPSKRHHDRTVARAHKSALENGLS